MPGSPIKVLLQTTIPATADDWSIARFSLLGQFLREQQSAPNNQHARVIAESRSKITGRSFNIAVAFEANASAGPAIAESSFHHFTDYNWDVSRGCPSFVTALAGAGMAQEPNALADTHRYVLNAALWLGGLTP